jgi:hypothetical protein
MLRSLKELRGYTLNATDGEIGKVHSCYFDDRTWVVRYFVIETGNWFHYRKVLIAPLALGIPNWKEQHIPVLLNTEQVKSSPSIDIDKPVSRQMEEELYSHYGWEPYWRVSMSPMQTGALAVAQLYENWKAEGNEEKQRPADPHLRSTREVIGYDIHATDGDLGQLDDFIVDDQMWPIRYLVVAMESQKVILSPHWVERVNWSRKRVAMELDKTSIKVAPAFDPGAPINREYEVRLYDYYGRPKYWVRM